MFLDTRTLLCATVLVLLQLTVYLFYAWNKNRSVVTLLWWCGAVSVQGLGVTLLLFRDYVPLPFSLGVANALLIYSVGMMWNGARLFNHRRRSMLDSVGALVWIISCQFEFFRDSYAIRLPVFMGFVASYMLLAGLEYLRSSEALSSRKATVVCFMTSALVYALPLPLALIDGQHFIEGPGIQVWFAVAGVQSLMFNLSASQLILLQTTERFELMYKRAALTDGLTGVANRTHFVQCVNDVLQQTNASNRPISLVLFDLDHFKSINDRSGHLMGDAVLTLFTQVAQSCLREGDLLGRVGGEEFGALLVDCDASLAEDISERVRLAFKSAARGEFGPAIPATVSAGRVTTTENGLRFKDLFAAADSALYRAKERGRDRSEAYVMIKPFEHKGTVL